MTEFHELLRTMREERNMTQADLGRASGMEQSLISHFECGRRKPCMANFARLCDALFLRPIDIVALVKAAKETK